MIEVDVYETEHGVCPYLKYLASMKDRMAQSAIMATIARMESGLMPKTRSLGGGLQEIKIQVGEGHRIYFYRDGQKLVVLLSGSNKKDQKREIQNARFYLDDYKGQKSKVGKVGKNEKSK